MMASKRSSTCKQRGVEAARQVAVGRGQELVLKTELVEEGAQPRVVGGAERGIFVRERVRHTRQRLAEMGRHHVAVGDIVGHLAQPVHVVGEGDQPGLDLVVGEYAKGMAHHGGACDLAEGTDMRQPRRAIAGLEDDLVLWMLPQPRNDLARLLERPGVRVFGDLAQGLDWGLDHGHPLLSGADTKNHTPRRQSKHSKHWRKRHSPLQVPARI